MYNLVVHIVTAFATESQNTWVLGPCHLGCWRAWWRWILKTCISRRRVRCRIYSHCRSNKRCHKNLSQISKLYIWAFTL